MPVASAQLQLTRRTAERDYWFDQAGRLQTEKEQMRTERDRIEAQIREALAILKDGTEYEMRHVEAILRDALPY